MSPLAEISIDSACTCFYYRELARSAIATMVSFGGLSLGARRKNMKKKPDDGYHRAFRVTYSQNPTSI